jgi:hypothetical protein
MIESADESIAAYGGLAFPGSRNDGFAVAPMPGALEQAMVFAQARTHQIGRTPCKRVTASASL